MSTDPFWFDEDEQDEARRKLSRRWVRRLGLSILVVVLVVAGLMLAIVA